VNLKFDVQSVGLNLGKSGLSAAYWARISWFEWHVPSLGPTQVDQSSGHGVVPCVYGARSDYFLISRSIIQRLCIERLDGLLVTLLAGQLPVPSKGPL
jgi:hypothetical protein